MNAIRKYLQTKGGRIAGVVAAGVALGVMILVLRDTLGAGYADTMARDRMFICAQTGKTFRHQVRVGETIPVESPHSGGKTGYPAEACYWTKDGGTKTNATYVLMNQYVGKSGPTFCPDCGRLVVPLNPAPEDGMKPPPSREQMKTASTERR